MENLKNLSESIICSGSDMNRRTFRDDESWNSLQSTILAANFSLSQDSSQQDGYNNLTTLSEKSASKDELEFKSVDEDDNVLNVNLDAISDEVFFDCQNVSAEFQFPTRKESASEVLQVPGIKEFLTTESPSSGNNASTVDSGVEEERTGALLVQIVEDFKDMKDHAQSTPKHLSPTTNLSKNLRIKSALNNNNNVNKINNNNNDDDVANNNNNNNNNNKWNNKRNNAIGAAVSFKNMTNVNGEVKSILGKKTLSCLAAKVIKRLRSPTYDQHSPVDKTNKENFFAGKYSSAVSAAHKPDANLPSSQPDKKPAPRKVAEMKEFFENKSKIYEQSRNRQIESRIPVRKGVGLKPILVNTKSPQLRNPRNARSPSYHTQETFKLLKSSKAFKMNNNNGGTSSFYLRNNTRTRPTSCSEFTPDASTRSAVSRNTSKSTNDLSRNDIKHSQLLYATERKMINKRSYVPHVNQCTTLNPKSPLSSLKVSDIMKRKSLGYVSSPVKPVKELRKIFSPGGGPNAKKRSHKKTPGIKIVISNE